MSVLWRGLSKFLYLSLLAALSGAVACSSSPKEEGTEDTENPDPPGCAAGLDPCGGGCVDLLADANNCGACAAACQAFQSCVAGACTCPAGTSACGTGCVDTSSDINNCGGCGHACLTRQTCSAGSCACPAGTADCGTGCVNLMSDGANCGTCGSACAPDQPCANGQCSVQGCPAELTQCSNADGTASCIDTNVELAHCGGCGNACAVGQSCSNGSCTCPAGQADCGGQCVNVTNNVAHCGGCDLACLAGQSCVAGACTCPAGQQACAGQCVDVSSSAVHCGDCGIQCRAGATCSAGTCVGGDSGGDAHVDVTLNLSEAIQTVVIAEWSVDVTIDRAVIHFGREQGAWEYSVDVDLTQPNYRTLLLGMKMHTLYYVQVEAFSGGTSYTSEVESIETGYLANGLPTQTITDDDASALYAGGGFTVLCTGYTALGGGQSDFNLAYIIDGDGDVVWALDLAETVHSSCSRARMSIDAQYMWLGNFGNTTTDGALMRITMDGLGPPDEYTLPGRSHDFAILPNEHIVYFARNGGVAEMAPESIWELDPATNATTLLYSELTDFGELFDARGGHTNQVNYVPELNAIAFSMYFIDTIALISYPEGQLMATFGGKVSTFSAMSWTGQHGHDVYADHMTLFNNVGSNGGASVLRFEYDLQAGTATQVLDYSSGLASPAFGDVKELPNGNYFVTYSTAGAMHELDASGRRLRQIETSLPTGYAEHRASLYGPPPPFDRHN